MLQIRVVVYRWPRIYESFWNRLDHGMRGGDGHQITVRRSRKRKRSDGKRKRWIRIGHEGIVPPSGAESLGDAALDETCTEDGSPL